MPIVSTPDILVDGLEGVDVEIPCRNVEARKERWDKWTENSSWAECGGYVLSWSSAPYFPIHLLEKRLYVCVQDTGHYSFLEDPHNLVSLTDYWIKLYKNESLVP